YVRFRDGNGLESPTFSRSILLDRTPPSGRALLHNDPAPWVELQAQDNGSGVAAVQLIDAAGNAGDWQTFQPALTIARQGQVGQVRFRDAAGNVSRDLPVSSSLVIYLPDVSS